MSTNKNEIDPNAPTQKSPLKWMALMIVVLVAATIPTLWGKEKISLKATPKFPAQLSAEAQHGRDVINEKCADCHGVDGTGGSRKGPPILHSMYRREIFPDILFRQAMVHGKREKNWRFGPMEPVAGITEDDIVGVIAFVRELQDATGIE